MNDMKRLLRYAGPYRRDMVLGAVLVLIETCFELFIPIMIADLIDVGVANHDLSYVYKKGVQMILCALMALITGLLYAHFAAKAAYGWGAEIRKAEYEKVQQYAFSNLDHFAVSSLITRMTTDVTVLQNMVNAGFRPVPSGNGNCAFLLDESKAGSCISCVPPGSGQRAFLDRVKSSTHVHKASEHYGQTEPGGSGRPHCHPCGESLCQGRI